MHSIHRFCILHMKFQNATYEMSLEVDEQTDTVTCTLKFLLWMNVWICVHCMPLNVAHSMSQKIKTMKILTSKLFRLSWNIIPTKYTVDKFLAYCHSNRLH